MTSGHSPSIIPSFFFLPRCCVKTEISSPFWTAAVSVYIPLMDDRVIFVSPGIARVNFVLMPNEELEPNPSQDGYILSSLHILSSLRDSLGSSKTFYIATLCLCSFLWQTGIEIFWIAVKYMYPLDKYSLLQGTRPSPENQTNKQAQPWSGNLLNLKCTFFPLVSLPLRVIQQEADGHWACALHTSRDDQA